MNATRWILFLVSAAPALAGCGATTVRFDVAPTIDTGRRPGVESTLSFGVGLPVDYGGRSHHYVQGRASFGGGLDGRTGSGILVTAAEADYVRWVEPRLDLRAGLRLAYRNLPGGGAGTGGAGAEVAVLPIVAGSDASWLVTQLCIGPALRVEYLWGAGKGADRGLFSAPLALELNFLAAGD